MHAGQAGFGKRQGVGGEDNLLRGDFLFIDFLRWAAGVDYMQFRLGAPRHVLYAVIFVDLRAMALSGAGQAGDEFAGIERAAGDFVYYS